MKAAEKTRRFKAAALDLDGTLLTTEKRLSERTLRVLNRLTDRGVQLLIATGRNLTAARRAMSAFKGPYALIAHNGAAAADGQTGRILFMKPLPTGALETLRDAFAAWDCDPFAYGVSNGTAELRWRGVSPNDVFSRYLNANAEEARADEAPLSERAGWIPLQAVAIEPREKVKAALASGFRLPGARLMTSGGLYDGSHWFLEALHADASKALAARTYAASNGFTLKEAAAVGDNLNDIELLRACGCGVAMGNAPEKVRRAADFVAGGNDEDGAALALERLFHLA